MTCRTINDKKSSSSRGFTLLELMVVMVLISLMTAFAVPGLRSSFFSDQLKTTTRKILGLVSEASQEAVSKHAEYSLYFDLEKNSISTFQEEQKEAADEQYPQGQELNIPDSVQLADVTSVHGGKQSQGKAVIRFSKKGYVDKTLIHLRSDDGDDMTIMLSPFLGVTKIFDSYIDLEDDRIRY
ncbi:MAG: prepilin-type N-terminal cleavage/methylation domain-containing protein [Desulfobulbaceae bacterium]|nr:prepilin-type N-terminal cleavage/methylation domain-containing protein [Desulfobulbaceae bacterium]